MGRLCVREERDDCPCVKSFDGFVGEVACMHARTAKLIMLFDAFFSLRSTGWPVGASIMWYGSYWIPCVANKRP